MPEALCLSNFSLKTGDNNLEATFMKSNKELN